MAFRSTGNTIISDAQNGTFNAVTVRNFFRQKTQAQGFNFGYIVGGTENTAGRETIYRFPFVSETTNSTNVGNLLANKFQAAGQSSTVSGYNSGGIVNQPILTPATSFLKFPFAAESSSTSLGGLTVHRTDSSGHSSVTHGYTAGGGLSPSFYNVVDRFSFSADNVVADAGDLTAAKDFLAGQSSLTHGYSSGGRTGPVAYLLNIERFPFATTGFVATNVGNLSAIARLGIAGQSSGEHGYSSGGLQNTGNFVSVIDRFPFAVATTNSTNVGNLTRNIFGASGHSSISHGYTSGGYQSVETTAIDRFPFAVTLTNAVSVGNLNAIRAYAVANQY